MKKRWDYLKDRWEVLTVKQRQYCVMGFGLLIVSGTLATAGVLLPTKRAVMKQDLRIKSREVVKNIETVGSKIDLTDMYKHQLLEANSKIEQEHNQLTNQLNDIRNDLLPVVEEYKDCLLYTSPSPRD